MFNSWKQYYLVSEIYVGWHGKDSGGQERINQMKENCLLKLVELVKFPGSFLMVKGYGVLQLQIS